MAAAMPASAQFNLKKAVGAASKAAQAVTLTDEQMAAYVKESVDWMDKNNPVPDENNEYTKRLRRLTEGLKDADGIPLNFKVYDVIDVNAFACPAGCVRVFSSLMDI
ncbi:MAG: peptidase, partial [Paramuribaculum intestinale]